MRSTLLLTPLLLLQAACALDTRYNPAEMYSYTLLNAAVKRPEPQRCIQRAMPAAEQWTLVDNNRNVSCMGQTCSYIVIRSDVKKRFVVALPGAEPAQLFWVIVYTFKSRKSFLGGEVNAYFHGLMEATWPYMEAIVNEPEYRDYDVTVTGYSLGASTAALIGAQLVSSGVRRSDQVAVRTLGEMRMGNVQFARAYNQLVPNSFRVVNRGDIVAHVPPCVPDEGEDCASWGPVYYHEGREVWYPNGLATVDSTYRICESEDPTCSNSLQAYNAKDHMRYFKPAMDLAEADGCGGY